MRRLILASQSPARLNLLRNAGFAPEVIVSGVDESGATGTPSEIALELAQLKCRAVVATEAAAGAVVIGCDSVLELDGVAYGKPKDAADAVTRWQLMAGRTGVLRTGHCIVDSVTGQEVSAVASTAVRFGTPSEDEVAAYVASGEPLVVAGAFTIDGRGSLFVEGLDGDHTNVIGLSMPLFRSLLSQLGIPAVSLWP
ncbi:Maf family protein [Cryptosporangium phraense]|uniref:Nucleoside triphosphate pyrophosphatase n=1 Tax=Cryptosporangium phraense TaxID=2593070 RepID=A0A545AUI1_9ACTN|nr:Maf family protein [Cryptosporangium phraense]TQS44989.1 septum formation inhibitor Maf [Cryptosporangium phraense]